MQTIVGRIFALVIALTMFSSGELWAKIDECQPDGMSDEEAARIIAIATDQGQKFRKTIDDLRAQGITYETDTTYENIMTDPERALALAMERYYSREHHASLGVGAVLERNIKAKIDHWIIKQNTNYYSIELSSNLKELVVLIGGTPMKSNYRYVIDPKKFIFALNYFRNGARLKYVWGASDVGGNYKTVNYGFSERWALYRRRPNYEIRVYLKTNLKENSLLLKPSYFGPVDTLKNGWPILKRNKSSCLLQFVREEE